MPVPSIAITPGELAGIGVDLCAGLAHTPFDAELIVLSDEKVLRERARLLGIELNTQHFDSGAAPKPHAGNGTLTVLHQPCPAPVTAGELSTQNAEYVMQRLHDATYGCLNTKFFDALVTAPMHKGVINDAGIPFTGHTEQLGDWCKQETGEGEPVMMLATESMRVALATTHVPLSKVSQHLTQTQLTQTIRILHRDLQRHYGLASPRIVVCGLNPHAGEGGHMGTEEIDIIEPVLDTLRKEGMNLTGPLPADTLFTPKYLDHADAVLAMFHDQGLPVLKYSGFGKAVNITLGLPMIRTSVDHGTALDLAGTGNIDHGSFHAAIHEAIRMANCRNNNQKQRNGVH